MISLIGIFAAQNIRIGRQLDKANPHIHLSCPSFEPSPGVVISYPEFRLFSLAGKLNIFSFFLLIRGNCSVVAWALPFRVIPLCAEIRHRCGMPDFHRRQVPGPWAALRTDDALPPVNCCSRPPGFSAPLCSLNRYRDRFVISKQALSQVVWVLK